MPVLGDLTDGLHEIGDGKAKKNFDSNGVALLTPTSGVYFFAEMVYEETKQASSLAKARILISTGLVLKPESR